jgi:hypothetical protein
VQAGEYRRALLCSAGPLCSHINDLKMAFQARAMLKLNEGDVRQAWSDLVLCRRLLHQMSLDPVGQYGVVGRSAEAEICQAEMQLLHATNPDSKQLKEMKSEWSASLRPPDQSDLLSVYLRCQFLDLVCWLESHPDKKLGQMVSDMLLPQDDNSIEELLADRHFNWNELLKVGNQWFDRMVQISRIENQQERRIALDRLHADFESSEEIRTDGEIGKHQDRDRSARLAFAAIRQFFESEFSNQWEAADRESINSNFVETSFGIAGYRAAHGEYPRRLAELAPDYLRTVPVDLFAARSPLRYRRVENGYLLYSVGPNGIDEEGGLADVFPDADDIAIVVSDSRRAKFSEETP